MRVFLIDRGKRSLIKPPMDAPQKESIELEVRRLLSTEATAQREHLEKQFAQLKWAVGVVTVIGAGMFAFFIGKTSSDVSAQARAQVEQRLIDYRINDDLRRQLEKTIDTLATAKPTTDRIQQAIQNKVSSLVTAESEGRVRKAIEDKVSQLKVRDFTKDIASLPVGSVIASLVAPDIFSQLLGDSAPFEAHKSLWILADGREVPGSRYAQLLAATKVPDLRGMFLRGVNGSRHDGKEDPDEGARRVGDYQADALAKHTHPFEYLSVGGAREAPEGSVQAGAGWPRQWVTNSATKEQDVGASETRPRNIAVFYYVRIN